MSRIREIITIDNGLVDDGNSTTTPLGIGGVFTGDWEDTLNYNTATIGVLADQDSATDGLQIQWSSNATTIVQEDTYTITANTGQAFSFSPKNRYLRVVYTNGGVAQGTLDIQSILKKSGFKGSSARVGDAVGGENDAELVKAVVAADDGSGSFTTPDIRQNADRNTNLDGTNGIVVNGVQYARVNDDTVKPARIDASTEANLSIDYSHHEAHDGNSYRWCGSSSDIDTTPVIVKIDVPAQATRIHLVILYAASGESVFTMTENPTGGATGGTVQTAWNRRRDAGENSTVTVTSGVTTPTGGNALIPGLQSGAGNNRVAAEERDEGEWILGATGTAETYVFELTSSINNIVGQITLIWYEHTDRN